MYFTHLDLTQRKSYAVRNDNQKNYFPLNYESGYHTKSQHDNSLIDQNCTHYIKTQSWDTLSKCLHRCEYTISYKFYRFRFLKIEIRL